MVPESPVAVPERELIFTQDAEKIISDYTADLTGGKLSLLQLIEKLGKYIVDPDEFMRYQGTYILSEVLSQLPSNFLTADETNKLIDFYCERVKDHFMLLPVVLKGLNSMMIMDNIHEHVPMKVLAELSDDILCQSLSQSNRYSYYSLFKSILHNHKNGISNKDMEFIRYIIAAMDGESDPRNLMFLFRLIPNVLRQFTLSETVANEMFLVLDCYFPVDFTPSSKFSITRDDLKEGLEDCLTSNPLFFPLCVPLILEKLESKLKTAHIDSLQLLMRQCRKWGGDSLKSHLILLWASVQDLIFGGSDLEVANLAIQAFALAISSAANCSDMEAQLKECLEAVSSTKAMLMDPSLNLFPQVMNLQGALAMASLVSAEHVTKNLLEHLLNLLLSEGQNKDVVMNSLIPILNASVEFDLWKSGNQDVQIHLNRVPEILFTFMGVAKLGPICTQCFQILFVKLSRVHRLQLYSFLKNSNSGHKPISKHEAKLIKIMALMDPNEVVDDFLENLSYNDVEEIHRRNVEILSWSSHAIYVTKYCCDKIISLLESNKFNDITIDELRLSCDAIENVEVFRFMGGKECDLVGRMLNLYCKGNLIWTDKEKANLNIAKIFMHIVSSMNSGEQKLLISKCFQSYFYNYTLPDQQLLDLSSKIVVLEGIVGSLHSNVDIPELDAVLHSLVYISLESKDQQCRLSSSRLIATIFNKYHNDELLNTMTDTLLIVIDSNKTNLKDRYAVHLASWICKALVLSNHPSHSIWIDMLISLLSSKELCSEVAEGFKIILTDSEEYLNRECHAKIGILYKQRLFENISKLITLQDILEGVCKNSVNFTISYFLKFSPPQVVINRLKELIRIIVRCLENADVSVSHSALEVISSLLATKNVIFEEYMSVLIPRCLTLSTSGPMDMRIAALECISLYSQFKEVVILPYQKKVVSDLAKCLDDKKRLVRKKAVEARTKWFLLGSI